MASLEPYNGLLGERLAKHLLRRATYTVSRQRIETFATMTANDAVNLLFTTSPLVLTEPIDWETGQTWINNPAATVDPPNWKGYNYIKAWWLNEGLHDTSITSKMKMFLHQYMTMSVIDNDPQETFDYMSLLRLYSTGSYKELALKMITDNAMSNYLDNRWNHKWNPNENFGREFLELFTIGKGPQIAPGNYTNYTEDDVQAAARLLTGWRFSDRDDPLNIDPDTGLAKNYTLYTHHDTNPKQFSSAFGNLVIESTTDDTDPESPGNGGTMWLELEQFVNMIFNQMATAENLCRRLYRYFVSWDITTEIETDIIAPLAQIAFDNNYDLSIIVQTLLKSEHFYNEDGANKVIGKLMKSPIDNVLQTMSFFEIEAPNPLTEGQAHYETFWWYGVMDNMLERSGMNFFEPNNVAGYAAYFQDPNYARDWFSSATIIARYKMGEQFLTGTRVLSWGSLGVQLDIVDFVQNSGVISDPTNATTIVEEFTTYLFAETPDTDRMNYYLDAIFLAGLTPAQWTAEWSYYLNSGDNSGVKLALESLVKSLLYSQENQLM